MRPSLFAGVALNALYAPCAGASSLASGQLEVMVNRRALASDELGNPEMLNEAEGCCGTHSCSWFKPNAIVVAPSTARTCLASMCAGVIARGTFKLILGNGHDAVHAHALHAQQMAWPVLPSFVKASGTPVNDKVRDSPAEPMSLPHRLCFASLPRFCWRQGNETALPPPPPPLQSLYSALRKGRSLPPDVHLLSLHDDGQGIVIFRLMNRCQVPPPARLLPYAVTFQLLADADPCSLTQTSLGAGGSAVSWSTAGQGGRG